MAIEQEEEKKKKRLFLSENAFRVYAALGELLGSENAGIMISEIALKTKISYGAARYWVIQFRSLGFIRKPAWELRKTSDARNRFQYVVYLSEKPLRDLERLVDCDHWLGRYYEECNPPLPSGWPLKKDG